MRRLFFILTVFCLLSTAKVLGATVPNYLKIGLEKQYKDVAAIPIKNEAIQIGISSSSAFKKLADLKSSKGFSVGQVSGFFVALPESSDNFELIKKIYKAQQSNANIALNSQNLWQVYLGEYLTKTEAEQIASSTGGKLIQLDKAIIIKGAEPIVVDTLAPLQIKGESTITLNDRSYRGVLEFSKNAAKGITPVNLLTMNEYLYAVVPSEIYSTWHIEALKAQAVAARTYAATQYGVHSAQGYDLCDTVHCQNYIGAGNEAATTTQAVNETKDNVIVYEGNLINAVYFSSSGGYTEASENVWLNPLPYLKAVEDKNETEFKTWQRTFTKTEIEAALAKQSVSIGSLQNIVIDEVTTSGRVNKLRIVGSTGEKILTKEEVRTFFSPTQEGSLDSRMFEIVNSSNQPGAGLFILNGLNGTPSKLYAVSADEKVVEVSSFKIIGDGTTRFYNPNATTGDTFVFSGKGYGHGVGMSQYGAKGMAESGYTYKQILEHYYTGASLQ